MDDNILTALEWLLAGSAAFCLTFYLVSLARHILERRSRKAEMALMSMMWDADEQDPTQTLQTLYNLEPFALKLLVRNIKRVQKHAKAQIKAESKK